MRDPCPCCGYTEGRRLENAREAVSGQSTGILAFDLLARRFGHWVGPEELADAVYGHLANGGPDGADNSIGVMVHRMKKRLEEHGLEIQSRRGPGGGRRLVWAGEKSDSDL